MDNTKKRNLDIFLQLTKRHLLVFFKNKIRLMYTMMVPIIIFVVYILFLRGLEIDGVKSTFAQLGIDNEQLKDIAPKLLHDDTFWLHVKTLIDCWMISGIIGLTTIAVSLQANSVLVEDKENGVNRDFVSSPIPKVILIGSYFLYNFIVTTIISLLFVVICVIYLAILGELALTFLNILSILGALILSVIASTLLTIFICSFIKTEGTLASVIAIFSTAIGFLIGAYMPLSMMPSWAQGLCCFIPGTYSCSLLRYGFMSNPLLNLSNYLTLSFGSDVANNIVPIVSNSFGYNLSFFGLTIKMPFQIIALVISIVILAGLNIVSSKNLASIFSLKNKKKINKGENK